MSTCILLRSRSRQSGFTLVEILIATTLTLLLSLAIFKIIILSQHMSDLMIIQTTLNSEARAVFDLLGEGRYKIGAFEPIAGYHGSQTDPSYKIDMSKHEYQLCLNSEICTREITKKVTCVVDNDPVQICDTVGQNITIKGYVKDFITTSDTRSVNGKTTEVQFTIMDPYRIPADNQTKRFLQSEYSTTFWTVFTRHVGT